MNKLLGYKIEWRNSFRIFKGIVVEILSNDILNVLETTDCEIYPLSYKNDRLVVINENYKSFINYLIMKTVDYSYDYRLKYINDIVASLDIDSKLKRDELIEYIKITLAKDILSNSMNNSDSDSDSESEDDDEDNSDNKSDSISSKVNIKIVITSNNVIRGFRINPSNGLTIILDQLKKDYDCLYNLYYIDNEGDRIDVKGKFDLDYCISNNKSNDTIKLFAETNDEFKSTSNKLSDNIIWQRGELLGSGSFGKVYKGLDRTTGKYIAVKEINLIKKFKNVKQLVNSIQSEIKLLGIMSHKNIIKYLGTEYLSDHIRIFLELATDGSIKDLLNSFGALSESNICTYTIDIVEGLEFLHSHKIVHRDIKPSNLLISNGVIKLGDFGCATLTKMDEDNMLHSNLNEMTGTTIYMSPEVMQVGHLTSRRSSVTIPTTDINNNTSSNTKKGYGRKTDIWSLGITLVEMSIGKLPFCNAAVATYSVCISKEYPTFPPGFSDLAIDFLNRCLVEDSKNRASANELKNHIFLKSSISLHSDSFTLGVNHIFSTTSKEQMDLSIYNKTLNKYSTNSLERTIASELNMTSDSKISSKIDSTLDGRMSDLFQTAVNINDTSSVSSDYTNTLESQLDESVYSSIDNTNSFSTAVLYNDNNLTETAHTVTTQSGVRTSRSSDGYYYNYQAMSNNITSPIRRMAFANENYDSDNKSVKSKSTSNLHKK